MIFYHLTWDLVHLYEFDWKWYESDAAYFWQQSICWIFILLSGLCWSFGRKKLKRGIIVSCFGILISVVTGIFLPSEQIVFGVLTLLGTSMLLLIPLEKFLCQVPAAWGLFISFCCFVIFKNAGNGYVGFGAVKLGALPEGIYKNAATAFLGFPHSNFYSTDYFPLVPWFFLFVSGYFLYRIIYEKEKLFCLEGKRQYPTLAFFSRHSLLLYLLHQPVIYVVLSLVLEA